MAIKLEDVFACINKSAETNQDPGAQAMAAAAQAATPPGGIPLPKPIEQPKEEGGENMVPEEKLQAEKEKLEAQRRAELEKKENEIRGLQHELDLERVERQKATAENELKEKSRQQEEKLKQEREKLDAERQKLEQDKAMQSNTQQAELIKHQADMERETSKQVADIAQQKAKAIEDIAKQNAQQYIKTTQQSQQQANRYFAEQQKKFKSENPVMSTALQNQINGAVSAVKSVANHHRKFASSVPVPGSIPIEKKAIYEQTEVIPVYGGVKDVTYDIGNYSPANQAKYIASEIAFIRGQLRDPEFVSKHKDVLPNIKEYEAKLNQTLVDIDNYVKSNKNSIAPKDLADYELLTQPKKRYGELGWNGWWRNAKDDIKKADGFWDTLAAIGGGVKDFSDELFSKSDVDMSDLDLIKNEGMLGRYEDLHPESGAGKLAQEYLGVNRLFNGWAPGKLADGAVGSLMWGLGHVLKGTGDLTGWNGLKNTGSNLVDKGWEGIEDAGYSLSALGGLAARTAGDIAGVDSWSKYGQDRIDKWSDRFKDNKGANITGNMISGMLGLASPNTWRNSLTNYDTHSDANDIISKYKLSEKDADELRDSYDVSSSPFWTAAGDLGLNAAGAIPYVGPLARVGKTAANAIRFAGASGRASRQALAASRGAWNSLRPIDKVYRGADRAIYRPITRTADRISRMPVIASNWSTPMYLTAGGLLPKGSDISSMYAGALATRINNNTAQSSYYRNQGSVSADDIRTHLIPTVKELDPRARREAFKYLRSDMQAAGHKQSDIDSVGNDLMKKSSSVRIPMPGDLPLEKKADLSDGLARTAQGRNMGFGWNQLNSPNYSMDKWSQNPVLEQLGKFAPMLNTALGTNIRLDYNTAPAFNRRFKPLDAGQLSAIVFNPGSDPLANPKRRDNSVIYTNLKNSMARKYGYEKKQYTTIPTAESNVFSKPKTS